MTMTEVDLVRHERLVALREKLEAQHQERIAAGHAKWGWPLDATCSTCGDTGTDPTDDRFCLCTIGVASRIEAERADAKREGWNRTEVPVRFRDYRLEGSPNTQAAAVVRRWIDDGDWTTGENLFLTGPVGTGKTGLAVGAMWGLFEARCPSLFYSVPDLLDRMRPGATADDPMERVRKIRALVLDDLGVEKPSDWVRERLYVLMNARYEAERPTIVTSNCDLERLAEQLGERTVSRFQEHVTVVAVGGGDRRRR